MPTRDDFPPTLDALSRAIEANTATPASILSAGLARCDAEPEYAAALLYRADADRLLERARQLSLGPRGPLQGALVVVKDNIDVAGMPTTAACPAFAHVPTRSATAVSRLEAAGAIVVGKANLDQFATGLAGMRSPYGEVPNSVNPEFVSGGSSSGSAVAVARGWVHASLGTDTAGSGRIPAAFNNIVGLKPSYGRIPSTGMLPACESLDCVSIFGATVADCWTVLRVLQGPDGLDPAADADWIDEPVGPVAPTIGIPPESVTMPGADPAALRAWRRALDALGSLGVRCVEVPWTPFAQAAALLYDGPFVAQRLQAAGELLSLNPGAIEPSVRKILEDARRWSAPDAFRATATLRRLKAASADILAGVDCLLVPSSPTFPTRSAVRSAPIERNAELGRYTNFVNLLDLCALAIPGSFRDDGLPAGVTLIGRRGADYTLADLGARWHPALSGPGGPTIGATGVAVPRSEAELAHARSASRVTVAVVGAHLSGMPLNGQLTERGGRLIRAARTAPVYRMYALPGQPEKPGLVRVLPGEPGGAIDVELWSLPEDRYGSFVALVGSPLCIGRLALENGEVVQGFVCESYAAAGLSDIAHHGGWRAYLRDRAGDTR